jgi:hypothetical protein
LKVPWHWLIALALLTLTVLGLEAAGTSLWFLVLGSFPAPMFWLITLVYVSVTRPLWEATMITYLICLVSAPFTVFPFEGFLIYSLMLMGFIMVIRERVFWGGPTYFMLMVALTSLSAPILFWLDSRWFDKNPLHFPRIFEWLIAGLLSTLFSLPLYRLYQRLDRFANQDAGSEGWVGPR